MAGDQSLLLSSNDNLSAQQINPYIIDLENNGTLSDGGQFATEPEDLNDLLSFYLPKAVSQWRLTGTEPIDIGIYAHGGLVHEEYRENGPDLGAGVVRAQDFFPSFPHVGNRLGRYLESYYQGCLRSGWRRGGRRLLGQGYGLVE